MRIALLSPVLGDAFGQERVMRITTELLRDAGHSVGWFGSQVVGPLPRLDAQYVLPEMSGLGLLSAPQKVHLAKKALLEALEEFSPDLVHLIDQFEARLQSAVCRRYPVVVSAHLVALTCPASTRLVPPRGQCTRRSGFRCLAHHAEQNCLSHFSSWRARAVAVADYQWRRHSLEGCARILAVSQYVADTLVADGWPREKVNTVYNPVRIPEVPTPLPSLETLKIACVTRLVPYKGVQTLLQALSRLKGRAWELSLAGTGSYAENLKKDCQELGLSARVKFLGHLSFAEVEGLLTASHVLVQSNTGPEPFGLSVAEAMAAGRAVIVTDVPALNETVKSGQTGIIVPPGDATALAGALQELLDDPRVIAKLGAQARDSIARRFSPQAHLEGTLAIYAQVLHSRLGLSRAVEAETV